MAAMSQRLPFGIVRRVQNGRRLSGLAEDAFYGEDGVESCRAATRPIPVIETRLPTPWKRTSSDPVPGDRNVGQSGKSAIESVVAVSGHCRLVCLCAKLEAVSGAAMSITLQI